MQIIQLIYASRPFGFDDSILNGILMDARRCNERDDISGALICRGDLYLQLLEGPEEAVDAAFERIKRDNRHLEVRLLSRRLITQRLFPGWAMRHDPARSWMWTHQEVMEGAVERATDRDVVEIFERLAREPADR